MNFNIRRDMCPIASDKNGRIEDIIAESVGVDKEEILGFDLSLYNRMHGAVLGADGEYFSAPRIDDLQCMYSTLEGFLNSESDDNVTVFAAFDNEEVAAVQSKGLNRRFCVMCLKEFATIRKHTKELLLKALCFRATMLMRCIRILRTSRTVQTVCI